MPGVSYQGPLSCNFEIFEGEPEPTMCGPATCAGVRTIFAGSFQAWRSAGAIASMDGPSDLRVVVRIFSLGLQPSLFNSEQTVINVGAAGSIASGQPCHRFGSVSQSGIRDALRDQGNSVAR